MVYATRTFDVPTVDERECKRCGVIPDGPLKPGPDGAFGGAKICQDCRDSYRPVLKEITLAKREGTYVKPSKERKRIVQAGIDMNWREYVAEHGVCTPTHKHGSNCYSRHGCRCDSCVAAYRAESARKNAAKRRQRAEARAARELEAKLNPEPAKVVDEAAERERKRALYARQNKNRSTYRERCREYVAEHGACKPSHNHSYECFQQHGCRCEQCVAARDVAAARKREKRAAAKAAANGDA